MDQAKIFGSKAADLFRQPCEFDLQGDVQGMASESDLSGKVLSSKLCRFKVACLWQSSRSAFEASGNWGRHGLCIVRVCVAGPAYGRVAVRTLLSLRMVV